MRLLKPGGVLALFWNHPLSGGGMDTPGDVALQKVYRKYGKGRRDVPFDGSSCPALLCVWALCAYESMLFIGMNKWI